MTVMYIIYGMFGISKEMFKISTKIPLIPFVNIYHQELTLFSGSIIRAYDIHLLIKREILSSH